MRNPSKEWRSSATNQMILLQKQITHLLNKEPIVIMKFVLILLLAGVCQTYTPITERSWVNFRKVKCPTYESSPFHEEPDIIRATDILIEERLDKNINNDQRICK